MPLPLPPGTSVRYVDRKPLEELRQEFPELAGLELVAPDIVDDGARLSSIEDESLDFVVANHFLEHCEDPIGALQHHSRVLKPGGVVYLALPDRRRQDVDRGREPVSVEHLVRDHEDGPVWSRLGHYEEWVRAADIPLGLVRPDDAAAAVAEHARRGSKVHFHAWAPDEFADLIERCHGVYLPLGIVEVRSNLNEFITILRKDADGRRLPERSGRLGG